MYTIKEISTKINKSESTIRDYISRNEKKFKGHISKRNVWLIDDTGFELVKQKYCSTNDKLNSEQNTLNKKIEELELALDTKNIQIKDLEGTIYCMKESVKSIIEENNHLHKENEFYEKHKNMIAMVCKDYKNIMHRAEEEIDSLRKENYNLILLLEMLLA